MFFPITFLVIRNLVESQTKLSFVAKIATLDNTRNLHKSNMATRTHLENSLLKPFVFEITCMCYQSHLGAKLSKTYRLHLLHDMQSFCRRQIIQYKCGYQLVFVTKNTNYFYIFKHFLWINKQSTQYIHTEAGFSISRILAILVFTICIHFSFILTKCVLSYRSSEAIKAVVYADVYTEYVRIQTATQLSFLLFVYFCLVF